MKWEYGEIYKKYDMRKEIKAGTGIVKVHDIFEKTPEFMLEADVVFCDPPYNQSALSSFYTKANLQATKEFSDFGNRLIEIIKEISPKFTFIESGLKQTSDWISKLKEIHSHIIVKEAYYYHSKKNLCNILCAYDDDVPECIQNLPFADEEKIIELICRNVDFDCIADPCMGIGLVGFYANRYGKKFVGTELNPKRLAVCVERVLTNQRGKIN